MKFSELYRNAREAVDRALRSLWAADACNPQQEAMGKAIRNLTKDIFAGEDSMPVVQCMNLYESVHSVMPQQAENLVGGLWDKISPQGPKHFFPFEHQYQSWDTLLNKKDDQGRPMSVCVTTGTGSGKTECFMLPLVADLSSTPKHESSVKAIFLYPLNALMEDQKERLEQLIADTGLTYTVYNGDLPETEPRPDQTDPDHERIRNKIKELRGEYIDENGDVKHRFPKMLYTREMVRKNPPDIILTNPTMLEYILLRKKDESLIDPVLKSLRWIVIDETHSYTGAGAAEMAMLLRRVCLAFNVNPHELRYATSSATFGNAKDPAEREKNELELRKFISGITGTSINQVRVIDGKRTGTIPEGEDHDRWQLIFDNDFVSLAELFPTGTVEDKLMALDEMCQRLGDKPTMKIKVHYFFRVPNNGLYIKLTEYGDGAFKIYTRNIFAEQGEPKIPVLELSRCRTCGEYVAVARLNMKTGEYEAPMADDSDMFDLVEDAPDSDVKTVVFGLSNECGRRGDNNQSFVIDPADPTKIVPGPERQGWHIVGNTHCSCPYCNNKQTKKQMDEKEGENSLQLDENETKLVKFRTSPDFISRLIAPSILNQLEKHPAGYEIQLHDGQQYLSFADSRQMAAKATINQNLAQERMWFYTTVFHELCSRKSRREEVMTQIKALRKRRDRADENDNEAEYERLDREIKSLRESVKNTLTWTEIADMVIKDPLCELFCRQFLKKSQANSETNADGSIPRLTLENYVHSIMVMYLAGHPVLAASPETLGLFHPVYPKLSTIKLPKEVEDFNSAIDNPELHIDEDDWQDLMRYFIDFAVRNVQAVYLKLSDTKPIDIWTTNRFMAEKPRRRPLSKPVYRRDKPSTSRVVRFIADLYARDKGIITNSDAQRKGYDVIAPVIDALWHSIAEGENAVLTHGETWNPEEQCFVRDTYNDEEHSRRLNLTEMSFKLYDEAWLSDVNDEKGERHTVAMRPISYSFKGYAPFLNGTNPVLLDESLHEEWSVYPYFAGSGAEIDTQKLGSWAKVNRSLLWNNGIWGEEGIFADRLRQIYLTPNLFIQAEHTAQVDKSVARKRQHSFKNHSVNILACSTTMEMGVNLGSLEAVMLSSVPPQPANYKQRAGRSGRNDKVKSACITLCGSDAIGLRTYYSPLEQIINRPVEVPTIDLMSPQVIQRHVNSFLVRWFGVFGQGNINQKVANYYTPFVTFSENGYVKVKDPLTGRLVQPDQKLGNPSGTQYDVFNQRCRECESNIPEALDSTLSSLLEGTCYSGKNTDVIVNARLANERCYSELSNRASDLYVSLTSGPVSDGYRRLIEMKYSDMLDDRLLNYWATHRFSPNANMPVNVLQFELRNGGGKDKRTNASSSNPSYSLREAIAQYVPGNTVVVDGVVYMVRGLECTNMFERVKTFQKIYRSNDRTTVDSPLPDQKKWEVNKDYALELVRPLAFLPDVAETTRVMDSNLYTRVSAQLIGANDWDAQLEESHLYSIRDNRESGDAKILYYNEGKGYGYAYCTRCGRAVIEDEPALESEHPEIPPRLMNPHQPKSEGQLPFHKALSGKNIGKVCSSRNDYSSIRRNVIIGDLVQTDYSEIRIRHKNQAHWISERDSEYNLLITLGVVITQSLAEILGKERSAIDFALTPNGHICVFDTNPGGAGYANQLRQNPCLMPKAILKSEELLQEALRKNSNDIILDKFTLRYLRYIDVESAINWIQEEKSFCR